MSIIKWRPKMDAIEKALTVVKKKDVQSTPGSSLELRRQPDIIDRVFEVRPSSGWGSNTTLNTNSHREIGTPIIKDQIELPRMCASRRMPAMARYTINANRWIYSCSIPVDHLTQHTQYDGRVHDIFQFHSSSYVRDMPMVLDYGVWCAPLPGSL
jgi:hypothetical protein